MATPHERLLKEIFGEASLQFQTSETEGGVIITKIYPSALSDDGTLNIPATIDGKPVVEIAEYALAPLMNPDVLDRVDHIVVPATVRTIEKHGLSLPGVPIKVDPDNPNYSSDEVGALFDKAQTLLISYPSSVELSEYRIPNTVVHIAPVAFADCESLETVYIPASVATIEPDAFLNSPFQLEVDSDNPTFSSIDGVLFNKNQTTILRYPPTAPFETYAIPETVTKVDSGAFESCNILSKVVLPASVEQIEPAAFFGRNLSFEVDEDNPNFRSISGLLFDKSGETLLLSLLEETEIPDGTKRIADRAFSVYNSTEAIHIPASVETIGESAFSSYLDLKTLTFSGAALRSIGAYAFYDCVSLTSVVLPNSVRAIGEKAFARCHELKELVLPEGQGQGQGQGLKTLGAEAFTECSSLESLTLPKSLVQIGYDAFSDSPIKLVVYKDSYAEKWAKENGVNYEIVE